MKALLSLQVENTSHCNAHCLFCPHSNLRENGFMTDELYEKIIDEASQLPNLQSFIPMLTGEPFLDKKYIDKLKLAREKLPNADIEIYTNGSLLTDEVIEQLKEIPGLRFSISVNGLKPETRRRMMGLDDYWEVIRALKAMERAGIKYRATMVAYPDIDREEIRAFIESGGTAIQYQSWAGIQYPYDRKRWTSCARVINMMTIRYNGNVCLCCFDPEGDVSFGNLNEQTIEEVWHSSAHQEYVIMHKQGRGHELPKCNQCTEG